MTELQILYSINIVVSFTLATCLFVVAVGRDREMIVWAPAFGLHGIVYILVMLRGDIPALLSITLANTLASTMLSMFTEGMYRFAQARPPRLLIWAPPVLTAITFSVFMLNYTVRLSVNGFISVFQMSLMIWSIVRVRHALPGRGRWIVIAAAIITALIFVIRAVYSQTREDLSQYFTFINSPSPVQFIAFTASIVALIMYALGVLLMYKERAEQSSLRLAMRDPLTHLGNRRMLEDVLDQWPRRVAGDQLGALLMMDLDNFKALNDSCGHTIGDQYLVEVAYRIRENTKAEDTVVRLGGDEFVVLLTGLGNEFGPARERAESVANRILEEVSRPYPFLALACQKSQKQEYQYGLSIGVSLFRAVESREDDLLHNADLAMYEAKKQGRHRVVFYSGGERP